MLFHIILITASLTASTFQFSNEAEFRRALVVHENAGWSVAFDDELPMGGIAMTLEMPETTKLIAINSKLGQ
jgi:hypothetical protein